MRRRKGLWAGCASLGVATAALGATYSWIGSGDGVSWNEPGNWAVGLCPGTPCFPRTVNDDATILRAATIDLYEDGTPAPYSIDDMYIWATNAGTDVTFDDGEGNTGGPTALIVDTMTLYGASGQIDEDLTVILTAGAKITG